MRSQRPEADGLVFNQQVVVAVVCDFDGDMWTMRVESFGPPWATKGILGAALEQVEDACQTYPAEESEE